MLTTALILGTVLAQTVSAQDAELIKLARAAVRAEVLGKALPLIQGHCAPQPVFITIERNGKVLGCRGDLTPRTGSLEQEVVSEARAAAAHDPRNRPLTTHDLQDFLVTVTVVSTVDQISGVGDLRPMDGLVLEASGKTGIVLPWEGKDPMIRLSWAYRKAGLALGTSGTLFRMNATRIRG